MKAKACIISVLALALSAGMAGAQSGSGSGSGAAPGKGAPKQPQTAISKKCSEEANAKNLHGKARQKFRRTCIRQAKKAG